MNERQKARNDRKVDRCGMYDLAKGAEPGRYGSVTLKRSGNRLHPRDAAPLLKLGTIVAAKTAKPKSPKGSK